MVKALEINRAPVFARSRLVLRDFDGFEVHRTLLFHFSDDRQAQAFAAWENLSGPGSPAEVEGQPLRILKLKEWIKPDAAWEGFIGDRSVGFFGDDIVRILAEEAHPVFEPGEPDWDLREIEKIDDRISALKAEIGVLEEERNRLRGKRAAGRAPEEGTHAPAP